MPSHVRWLVILCALVPIDCLLTRLTSAAPDIWTGPELTFSIPSFATPSLPANQDRLTDNVWITRTGPAQGGIFNIKVEDFYSTSGSPTDTLWATSVLEANDGQAIVATNYANLTFSHWAEAFGGPGPALLENILSLPAVMHLVTDDIYLDIQFTEFDSSGLTTYERSTPTSIGPVPSGDYNNDGIVDAADYTVWRNTLGQNADPEGSGADGNANGEIDGGDYLFWKERYGDVVPLGTGSGGLATVPEPSALALSIMGCFLILSTRHRPRGRAGLRAAAMLFLVSGALTTSARADFHLWYIKEIYSNHDGSVQFIELFTTSTGQQNLFPGHSLTSIGNTFVFPNDSPTPTNNRHLLIATTGFGSIPGGATPNYTIPSNFFNPAGDTINFAGVSSHAFGPGNPLPTDGINSLNYTTFFGSSTVAMNSPRNHAGLGTSISLPPPPMPTGDYNEDGVVDAADYTVWRNTLGQEVDPDGSGADGNASGEIDAGDYLFWKERYGDVVMPGTGGLAIVPEPASLSLVVVGLAPLFVRRR
jgi:hypothetical protein